MVLNETIILNEKEYTVTLNRESAVHIERYSKTQENLEKVSQSSIEYVDVIQKGENPFEMSIDEDKLLEEINNKEEILISLISKGFWIWLHPVHKMDYEDVRVIISEYMNDENKSEFITKKYFEYLDSSSNIRQKFVEEQKKLKAQATKKN